MYLCPFHQTKIALSIYQQAGDGVGTKYVQATIDPRTNKRSYASEYLKPVLARLNLHVLVNALACKIASSSSPNTSEFVASGVYFKHGERMYNVRAKKEVIVSAGYVS